MTYSRRSMLERGRPEREGHISSPRSGIGSFGVARADRCRRRALPAAFPSAWSGAVRRWSSITVGADHLATRLGAQGPPDALVDRLLDEPDAPIGHESEPRCQRGFRSRPKSALTPPP